MKKNKFFCLVLIVYSQFSCSQPGTVQMHPVGNLNLQPKKLIVPPKYDGIIDTNLTVYLPAGFSAKVFFAGTILNKPRFMAWSPDSVLHVANMNAKNILALPDKNHDGVADTVFVAADFYTDTVTAHDVKFYKGAMYVAQETRVLKFTDTNNDGYYETKSVFIDTILAGATFSAGGGHQTRTIVFDSVNQKMYLSIGSACNVCRESGRAEIQVFNDDGTGERTFATGIRNAVGMALHPKTHQLWATNNGSDKQGDDIPPEWIDIVRDGGFYGHPFAYANQVYFDFSVPEYAALLPLNAADSAMVSKMVQPAGLVQAHSALMAITFINNSFLPQFQNGAFVAYRGSWNRTVATGYKIVYLDFDHEFDTTANFAADFMTGFLTDSVNSVRWARPVGLLTDQRGNLYMGSDEINQFIAIVYRDSATGVDERGQIPADDLLRAENFPNPFSSFTKISFQLTGRAKVNLFVMNLLGEKMATLLDKEMNAGKYSVQFDGSRLPGGIYFYQLMLEGKIVTKKMMKE